MADGNFKADHVRHKKPAADVWLSPGGGMIPEVQEIGSRHNKNNDLIKIEIKRERAEVSSDSVGSAVAAGGVAVGLPQCVQLR